MLIRQFLGEQEGETACATRMDRGKRTLWVPEVHERVMIPRTDLSMWNESRLDVALLMAVWHVVAASFLEGC